MLLKDVQAHIVELKQYNAQINKRINFFNGNTKHITFLTKDLMFGFPTVRAWRNALLLFIPAYGAATVIFGFAFWLLLLPFFYLLILEGKPYFFFLVMALTALVVASIWYLLIDLLYLLSLRLLWSSPPKFLLSPPSLKQKLTHLGVSVAATFPLAVIYVISFTLLYQLEELTKVDYILICAPDFMLKFSWLWLISTAYIYHWKYTLGKRKQDKK